MFLKLHTPPLQTEFIELFAMLGTRSPKALEVHNGEQMSSELACSPGQSEAITTPGQLRRLLFGWIPIADWDSEERNRYTGTLPLPRRFRESVEIFREKGKSRPVWLSDTMILSRSFQVDVMEWPMLKAMLNRLTVD